MQGRHSPDQCQPCHVKQSEEENQPLAPRPSKEARHRAPNQSLASPSDTQTQACPWLPCQSQPYTCMAWGAPCGRISGPRALGQALLYANLDIGPPQTHHPPELLNVEPIAPGWRNQPQLPSKYKGICSCGSWSGPTGLGKV